MPRWPKKESEDVSRETIDVPPSIVSPIVEINGDVHPMKDFEAQNEMPTLKSVGLARISPHSKEFFSYIITSRGNEVLNIEVSEPNIKAISADEAKTNFVLNFLDAEF